MTVSPTVLGFVRQLLGEIAFDPCSADWCAEHIGAHDWCGVDTDGLVTEWPGSVWVFPPPELADPFISKTLLELEAEQRSDPRIAQARRELRLLAGAARNRD